MLRIRAAIDEDTELKDFNAGFDAMGLDLETDFYDFLHCDLRGAVKFSSVLSRYILTIPGLSPGERSEELWSQRENALDSLLETLSY